MAGRRRPFLFFYLAALLLAAVIAPLRAMLIPAPPPGVHPYQELWDWLAAHDYYINLKNLLLYAYDGHAWAYLIFVFASIPTTAAVLACLRYGGKSAVAALFRRLHPWSGPAGRANAPQVYLLLLAFHAVGIATYLVVGHFTGTAAELAQVRAVLGPNIAMAAAILLVGVLLDEGGTLEELGWRGYALPLLQQRYSPLTAAILLGVLWWAWHFPREIPQLAEHIRSAAFWSGQLQFVALTVLLAIVMAYFVNRSGGSVLPAIIIHGGINVWSKALGFPVHFGIDLRLPVLAVVVGLILISTGARLGLAPGERLTTPLDPERGR